MKTQTKIPTAKELNEMAKNVKRVFGPLIEDAEIDAPNGAVFYLRDGLGVSECHHIRADSFAEAVDSFACVTICRCQDCAEAMLTAKVTTSLETLVKRAHDRSAGDVSAAVYNEGVRFRAEKRAEKALADAEAALLDAKALLHAAKAETMEARNATATAKAQEGAHSTMVALYSTIIEAQKSAPRPDPMDDRDTDDCTVQRPA